MNDENSSIVLIVAKNSLFIKLREALGETNLELLHAQTKDEAITFLERLKTQIDVAIIQLEFETFGGWDLIGELTRTPRKAVKIIATTSIYPEPTLRRVKELGVDVAVPQAISPDEWHRTVEAVLRTIEDAPAS